MPLDKSTLDHLIAVKDQIQELLLEISEVAPPDFALTLVMRYTGEQIGVKDMIWTQDIHDSVMRSLEEARDNMDEVES